MNRLVRLFAKRVLILISAVFAISFLSHQVRAYETVYDPTRHATDIEENVRKALHDAEELIRLMEQINNQLVMIEYWKKNLMNLNFTSLDEVATTMGKLQSIVDQAPGLGYKLEGMGTEFTTLYGEFGGEAVSSELYHKQYKAWLKQTRDGVQNAFEAQGIVMTNPDHKAAIENLIKQSQSAEGTLQALQAANQISGVIISQLNELKTLTAANGQALSSYLGYKAAVDDHGRAWSENFFKPVKYKKDIPTPGLYPLE